MSFAQTRNVEVKTAYTLRALKKSTRAPTNVSNAKRAVTCSMSLLRIRNHVLPYLVGPTALEKRQSWITKKRNSHLECNSASSNQNSPRQKQRKLIMILLEKRKRYYNKWNNSVTLLLAVLLQHKFTFLFIFQLFYN